MYRRYDVDLVDTHDEDRDLFQFPTGCRVCNRGRLSVQGADFVVVHVPSLQGAEVVGAKFVGAEFARCRSVRYSVRIQLSLATQVGLA